MLSRDIQRNLIANICFIRCAMLWKRKARIVIARLLSLTQPYFGITCVFLCQSIHLVSLSMMTWPHVFSPFNLCVLSIQWRYCIHHYQRLPLEALGSAIQPQRPDTKHNARGRTPSKLLVRRTCGSCFTCLVCEYSRSDSLTQTQLLLADGACRPKDRPRDLSINIGNAIAVYKHRVFTHISKIVL